MRRVQIPIPDSAPLSGALRRHALALAVPWARRTALHLGFRFPRLLRSRSEHALARAVERCIVRSLAARTGVGGLEDLGALISVCTAVDGMELAITAPPAAGTVLRARLMRWLEAGALPESHLASELAGMALEGACEPPLMQLDRLLEDALFFRPEPEPAPVTVARLAAFYQWMRSHGPPRIVDVDARLCPELLKSSRRSRMVSKPLRLRRPRWRVPERYAHARRWHEPQNGISAVAIGWVLPPCSVEDEAAVDLYTLILGRHLALRHPGAVASPRWLAGRLMVALRAGYTSDAEAEEPARLVACVQDVAASPCREHELAAARAALTLEVHEALEEPQQLAQLVGGFWARQRRVAGISAYLRALKRLDAGTVCMRVQRLWRESKAVAVGTASGRMAARVEKALQRRPRPQPSSGPVRDRAASSRGVPVPARRRAICVYQHGPLSYAELPGGWHCAVTKMRYPGLAAVSAGFRLAACDAPGEQPTAALRALAHDMEMRAAALSDTRPASVDWQCSHELAMVTITARAADLVWWCEMLAQILPGASEACQAQAPLCLAVAGPMSLSAIVGALCMTTPAAAAMGSRMAPDSRPAQVQEGALTQASAELRPMSERLATAGVYVAAPGLLARELVSLECFGELLGHRDGVLAQALRAEAPAIAATGVELRVGLATSTWMAHAITRPREAVSVCRQIHQVLDSLLGSSIAEADFGRAMALYRNRLAGRCGRAAEQSRRLCLALMSGAGPEAHAVTSPSLPADGRALLLQIAPLLAAERRHDMIAPWP